MPRLMSGIVARQRTSCSRRAGSISASIRHGACGSCPIARFTSTVGGGLAPTLGLVPTLWLCPTRSPGERALTVLMALTTSLVSFTSSLSLFTSASFSLPCVCDPLLLSLVGMGFFLCLRSYGLHDELAVLRVDLDRIAFMNGAIENTMGDTVLDLSLDDALEGPGPELRVVAHLC